MTESPESRGGAAGDREQSDDAHEPDFRQAFGALVQNSGVARVKPGEIPTVRSLLSAVGGVRGLVEAILPGLGFLVLFTVTSDLLISVLVPVVIGIAFVLVRVITRTPILQSVVGLIGLGISAGIAIFTGRPEDNFVLGFILNSVYLLVFLISLVVRFPLIGLAVGALAGEGLAWRQDKAKFRVLTIATVLWAGLFALRLAVQLPLYFAAEAELLAAAKLVLGVPVYAVVLWVTWLLIRTVYARPGTPVVGVD